jgi:predicted component of type VI protein secretion system
MPRLVITKGAQIGRDHAIGTECVLGRASDVDFPIDDNLVSRRHVRVYRDGDGYSLEDLGSRNGTVVNGRRIVKCSLADGDTIGLGATELLFTQKSLVATPPAAARPAVAGPPGATAAVKVPPAVARPAAKPAAPVPAAPPAAAPAKPAPGPLVTKRRRPLS